MRNRWLLNLVLLIVIVTLAVGIFYRTRIKLNESELPLSAIAPDAVQHLDIERIGQPAIKFERIASGWSMTTPIAARGNTFNIDAVLRIASAVSEGVIPIVSNALDRFGLDRPQMIVRIDRDIFEFGTRHPLKNQYYVRYQDKIHLIDDRYFAAAAASYPHYIDTRLLEDARKPIAFKFPDFSLMLANGTWKRQPDDSKLSADRINAFIDEWRFVRALNVERYSKRAIKEQIHITFTTNNEPVQKLMLGILSYRPEFVLYRKDEGLEYHFPEETGRRLLHLSFSNEPEEKNNE